VLVVKPAASYLNPQVRDEFRRIIVPLDGSSLAERVLPSVVSLAMLENSEIILLNVQRLGEPVAKGHPGEPVVWEKANFAATHAYLRWIAEKIRCQGVTTTSEIVIGENVAEEITAFAARERADLIAIATHGRGGLSRMLRSSVADTVTRSARASIYALHPGEPVAEKAVRAFSAAERVLAGV
jgi:nucleotide-binding universal stress UspA family protein